VSPIPAIIPFFPPRSVRLPESELRAFDGPTMALTCRGAGGLDKVSDELEATPTHRPKRSARSGGWPCPPGANGCNLCCW